MNKISPLWVLSLSLIALGGCVGLSAGLAVHDEVLVYPLPYDLAYLRTYEAVDTHPDWEPEVTDKENGVILLRNIRYSKFAQASQRTVKLLVKRIRYGETSVELAPESQKVIGGDELLALIKQHLSRQAALR